MSVTITKVQRVTAAIFVVMAGGGDFSPVGFGLGLVLPILYLIAAFQSKSSAASKN